VAPAFQFVFFIVGSDPVRFRPMMVPSVLEKFGYTAVIFFGIVDFVLGLAF
jgi:hypothetical protein